MALAVHNGRLCGLWRGGGGADILLSCLYGGIYGQGGGAGFCGVYNGGADNRGGADFFGLFWTFFAQST